MQKMPSLANIRAPAKKRIALRVTSAAERALRQGHPWIFDQAITSQSHEGKVGDLAVIFDKKRKFLAIGLYEPDSAIRVRVLATGKAASIDLTWFAQKLRTASQRRKPLLSTGTTGYRLVHGENDGLPGLVIDRYAETLVVKLYTAAWLPHLQDVFSALGEVMPFERLVLRLGRAMRQQNLYGLYDGMVLFGEELTAPVLFKENGLHFEADLLQGQKTGFFFDQRDNRARVGKISKGKSVLNVFSYTGGFSVYAARGGAKEVVSVDMSAPALDAAVRNMSHSHLDAVPHEIIADDAFEVLARLKAEKRLFDVVAIDPPTFARNQAQVESALGAYRRLTQMGLSVLRHNGTLVQASCSSRVDAESFFGAIHQAAVRARRSLQEIERTGHAIDHPIGFKEGAYLKCLFAIAL